MNKKSPDDEFFSEEYSKEENSSEKLKEVVIEESKDSETNFNDYTINKPKRITIRAKIIND